jgi:2-polyprenyl-3-methyl-5-hydroxy-6-metoxy-1,4-benzoquinol methylase
MKQEQEHASPVEPSVQTIMEIGLGFWRARTLLSAVELELFTRLGDRGMTGAELQRDLGLHDRATPDFFDALVAMGVLAREGDGPGSTYRNTPGTARFLDKRRPEYAGGMLEMAAARLYGFWGHLTEALRTGKPQNEIKATGAPMFAELYADPARLEQFMDAMRGISAPNFQAFAEKFDFRAHRTLCDVGGATGQLSMIVASRHPHMSCHSVDLPEVTTIAARRVAQAGLADRVTVDAIDFFHDAIPKADVVTMGMILHDWNLENKKRLIRKAFEALSPGGVFVAIESLIDDARRTNVFGLMMSLNMLIEFGDAFDYTGADFDSWCREAGFQRTEVMHLVGPASAAIAYR